MELSSALHPDFTEKKKTISSLWLSKKRKERAERESLPEKLEIMTLLAFQRDYSFLLSERRERVCFCDNWCSSGCGRGKKIRWFKFRKR